MLKLLCRLFRHQVQEVHPPLPTTSGEYITQITGGANLVDGVPTWQLAETKKHDLATMQRCCIAELASMARGGGVAAPFYFERVAILLRKAKDYEGEIAICERYIDAVDAFYATQDLSRVSDVRRGPQFPALKHRLAKARKLAGKD